MKKNIGLINATIRIMFGFIFIGQSTANLVRKPHCLSSMLTLMLGAMKVASGITRFCPLTYLMVKYEKKLENLI